MVKTNRLCLVVFYGWMEIVSFSFCVGFYGTMFLVYEEILAKKARRLHTLESRATKPYLETFRFNKSLSKAYVKTAHAVYESTKLLRHGAIPRYSRGKIGRFDSRFIV